jgi:FkbM family methyltransferase
MVGSLSGAEQCVWEQARLGQWAFSMCTYFRAVDVVISREVHLHGCYECDSLRAMTDALLQQTVIAAQAAPRRPRRRLLLDVGGNIGMYALTAAAAGVEAHVFEPVPLNALKILASTRKNNFSNLHLYTMGASNKFGAFAMATNGVNQGYLPHRPLETTHNPARVALPVAPLQDVLPRSVFEGSDIFLKMDVEGSECYALRGMTKVLLRASIVGALIETVNLETLACVDELVTPPHGAFHLLHTRHGLCPHDADRLPRRIPITYSRMGSLAAERMQCTNGRSRAQGRECLRRMEIRWPNDMLWAPCPSPEPRPAGPVPESQS